MPRKTDGEKIDELEKLVATLSERVSNVRADVQKLEKSLEESSRKRWMLVCAVIGVFGTMLGVILSWLFTYLARR